MRVVEFITRQGRRAYRAHPAVAVGTPCYAVQDEKTGLYFVWSYVHRAQAEVIAAKVTVGDPVDISANWRRDVQQTIPSSRAPQDA